MIRRALMAFVMCWLALCGTALFAQERVTLGWGRLLGNDVLGDLHDRWQTGSYTLSVLRGPRWTGTLPGDLGALLEYRVSGSAMTAANAAYPAANDRAYVAPLALGVHSHVAWAGLQASLGVDLVATGPQTGIGRLQTWLHEVLAVPVPDLTNQAGNRVALSFQAELGRDFAYGPRVTLHPFVAAQAGPENLIRAGGDVVIGSFGTGGLMLRDGPTGQRYRGIAGVVTNPAMSLTLGGDVAHVVGSDYLPQGSAAQALTTRSRLRAGLAWQGERSSAFYGVTYLTPEFVSQSGGQVIGSVNLSFRF